MKNKTGLFAALLLAGTLVAAQGSSGSSLDSSLVSAQPGPAHLNRRAGGPGGGFGPRHGALGLGLRGFLSSEGSALTATFYDADPAAGGAELSSLSFTAGEDSESAFLEDLQAARETAAFMVLETGEQTRTLELPEASEDAQPFGPRGWRLPLRQLSEGSTVTFFDGDPEALGSELSTLSFTVGVDSELAFENDLEEGRPSRQPSHRHDEPADLHH